MRPLKFNILIHLVYKDIAITCKLLSKYIWFDIIVYKHIEIEIYTVQFAYNNL